MKTARTTILLVSLLVPVLVFQSASAEDVYIDATDYIQCQNIDLAPIAISPDSWLTGLDFEGEWVEYHFEISGFGVNSAELLVMGTTGVPFSIQMTVRGDVNPMSQVIFFNFTGTGFTG
jgi:hypothetical protein